MTPFRSALILFLAVVLYSGCRRPEYEVIPVLKLNWIGDVNNSYYHYYYDPAYFVNEQQGVLGGYNCLGYTGNGGVSWNDILGERQLDYNVVDINPVGNVLIAFVDYLNSMSDSIYQSTDNGQHWQVVSGGSSLLHGQAISQTEYFKTAHTTSSNNSPVTIYHTTNAGTTWTALTLPVNFDINRFYFSNSSTAVIIGSIGEQMYYTGDGGASWQAVANGRTHFSHLKKGGNRLFAGYSETGPFALIYSDDNGLNWQQSTIKTKHVWGNGWLEDLSFSGDGTTGFSAASLIFISDDSGVNWTYYYNSNGTSEYEVNLVKTIITPGGKVLGLTGQGYVFEITY